MIIRTLQSAQKSNRRIVSTTWESTRLLLKNDNMGFSFHITTIYAGTKTSIWYQNHLESVYCISGEGEVETCEDGEAYPISAGTLYILNRHDQHILRAKTEMQMACVFNPALIGNEVHDKNGVYPLEAEVIID